MGGSCSTLFWGERPGPRQRGGRAKLHLGGGYPALVGAGTDELWVDRSGVALSQDAVPLLADPACLLPKNANPISTEVQAPQDASHRVRRTSRRSWQVFAVCLVAEHMGASQRPCMAWAGPTLSRCWGSGGMGAHIIYLLPQRLELSSSGVQVVPPCARKGQPP